MSTNRYARPPIIEAVIEIRFSPAADAHLSAKLSRAFKKHYANIQELKDHSYEFNVVNEKMRKTDESFFKFSSQHLDQIAIIKSSSLILSQLAPYGSWKDFIGRFERDFELHRKASGYYKILRIGVRYINRIDIPRPDEGNVIHESDYLNIFPKLPELLSPLDSYAIQTSSRLDAHGTYIKINSAVVDSPIVDHMSIVLDQDIGRELNVPQQTEDVISFLYEARAKKNAVFEACITDKTRGLFNK